MLKALPGVSGKSRGGGMTPIPYDICVIHEAKPAPTRSGVTFATLARFTAPYGRTPCRA